MSCCGIAGRFFSINTEITRKLSHVGTGVVAFFSPDFLSKNEIIILSVLFLIVILITKHFGLLTSVHDVKRKTFGEFMFPVAVGISALIFLTAFVQAFQYGILILTFSDPAAGIIGSRYGKHKISLLGDNKSAEGSLAFFVTALISTIFFIGVSDIEIYKIILITLVLTITELISIRGFDNLSLPIVSGSLFVLIL